MKRLILLIAVLSMLALAGCGLYDREYISVNEYIPTDSSSQSEGTVTVKDTVQLKKAIQDLVYREQSSGTIHFDPSYDGEPETDIRDVCMQLRLNDAICAYCEVKFTYKITPIVNYSEAEINISYSGYAEKVSNIIVLPYSVGIEEQILKALDTNAERLVIMISASNYSSLQMRTLVSDVFRHSPAVCPVEPDVNVFMYSGEDNQRLYEINFKYSLSEAELIRRKSLIKNLDISSDVAIGAMDDLHKVYALCDYFSDNCSLTDDSAKNTLYDAMIMHESNSEGLALAFVESAHRLELASEIVYGQYNGADYCWNIVEIDGQRYHIDVSSFMQNGIIEGFIKNDNSMNQLYRWDTSSYIRCEGELTFYDLPEYLPEGYTLNNNPDTEIIAPEGDMGIEIVVEEDSSETDSQNASVVEKTPQDTENAAEDTETDENMPGSQPETGV